MLTEYTDGVLKYRKRLHNLNTLEVIGAVDAAINILNIPNYYRTDEVCLPIVAVAERAFAGYSKLEIVNLGDNIAYLENYAFAKCRQLREVHHNALYSPVDFMFRAFAECRSLKTVDVNIGFIGTGVFWNCVNLEELYISGMCTEIQDYAFDGCCSLSKITCLASVHKSLEIHPMTFYGGRIEELHINRNIQYNDRNIQLSRPFEDYFHRATKIYCPSWSNLCDLSFVGRNISIEEVCI